MTIDELYTIILNRKNNPSENSYVTSLFKDGEDRIIQKVGEEATEVIIAAKNRKKGEIISEYADLLFHSLILLASLNITPQQILKELEKRNKKIDK